MTGMNAHDALALELENLPIFEGMTAAERQQLLAIASTMEFTPGEVVLRQDRRSQNLWVVLEGKCQIIKHVPAQPPSELVLAEMGKHEHFGDMSFFHDAPHSASVKAVTRLRLLRLERRHYEELIQAGSLAAYKLAYNTIDELADRLRKMDVWVTDLLSKDLPDRQASEWNRFREKLFSGWTL
jgi:CRP-like cAMP-binding protein